MTKRLALLVIFGSMLVVGAGYLSAYLPGGTPRLATFAFALATASMMTAILVLGAARRGRALGALRWVFAFTFAVMAIGFCAALIPSVADSDKLWLGLPAGAATILYVVGLLPMLVLPIAYAVTFERVTMDDAELQELRDRLAALRPESADDAPTSR